MGRRDFVSSKSKSAFLATAKKQGSLESSLKEAGRLSRGMIGAGDGEGEEKSGLGGTDFSNLMNSIVFKDELRDYVTSIINNAEPNEYVYDDIRVAAGATKVGASGPTFGDFGNFMTWLFPTNEDKEVFFNVQLPHSWMEGTDLQAHIHWAPVNTNTGDVAWCLEYVWANISGSLTSPATLTPTPDPGDGEAFKHQYHEMGTISGTGKTISSMLLCRLYRDTSEDDYNADAALLEFDFHIQLDSRGSSTETAK